MWRHQPVAPHQPVRRASRIDHDPVAWFLREYWSHVTGEALWAYQGRTEVLAQDARERR